MNHRSEFRRIHTHTLCRVLGLQQQQHAYSAMERAKQVSNGELQAMMNGGLVRALSSICFAHLPTATDANK